MPLPDRICHTCEVMWDSTYSDRCWLCHRRGTGHRPDLSRHDRATLALATIHHRSGVRKSLRPQ